jgi:hypothetical protein
MSALPALVKGYTAIESRIAVLTYLTSVLQDSALGDEINPAELVITYQSDLLPGLDLNVSEENIQLVVNALQHLISEAEAELAAISVPTKPEVSE